MYSTGKIAILYTGASPGLELTTYETCAPCNTCKVFIKGSKQIPKKIWVFFFSFSHYTHARKEHVKRKLIQDYFCVILISVVYH